jgi:hypothetical protein
MVSKGYYVLCYAEFGKKMKLKSELGPYWNEQKAFDIMREEKAKRIWKHVEVGEKVGWK